MFDMTPVTLHSFPILLHLFIFMGVGVLPAKARGGTEVTDGSVSRHMGAGN